MAALTVIGGTDNRPHLGGGVKHETYGNGTIARITPKGRIHVQFEDGYLRACRLTELVAVSLIIVLALVVNVLLLDS